MSASSISSGSSAGASSGESKPPDVFTAAVFGKYRQTYRDAFIAYFTEKYCPSLSSKQQTEDIAKALKLFPGLGTLSILSDPDEALPDPESAASAAIGMSRDDISTGLSSPPSAMPDYSARSIGKTMRNEVSVLASLAAHGRELHEKLSRNDPDELKTWMTDLLAMNSVRFHVGLGGKPEVLKKMCREPRNGGEEGLVSDVDEVLRDLQEDIEVDSRHGKWHMSVGDTFEDAFDLLN
ncbi:hypothetical protein P7C73_g3029, partial [Tremellales sp. Uapishka_1]